jgi:hypothetical protein
MEAGGGIMRGFKESMQEAIRAVMPITVVVIILQVTIVWMPLVAFLRFLIGSLMVTTGLMLFLRGVKMGLLPMGEMIGSELPKRGSVTFLILLAFVLGFSVTLAEPTVRVLAHQMQSAAEDQIGRNVLILSVAFGAGVFLCLAMLRVILGFPIAYLLGASYALVLILSFFAPPSFVPIAFDSGGVTIGPVTAPFIIALGVGTTAVLGDRSSVDGFGMVGLATVGPIIGVMILGIVFK